MIIAGFDPGLSGGICFHNATQNTSAVFPMPVLRLSRNGKEKGEIDAVELSRLVDAHGPLSAAYVEQVGSMPGQGVSSSFAFGKGYGVILGVLAANFIPTRLVSSVKWKRAMGITSGAGKDASRALASTIAPHMAGHWSRVKDDGIAEAFLIAVYGAKAESA